LAVYTHVPDEAAEALLGRYELGSLAALEPALEGVENTNYFLATEAGRFILTLFERRVDPADLPFFIALMRHLSAKGFPAPTPVADREGAIIQSVCGRPAAIFSFLKGAPRMAPAIEDCAALGRALARLHLAAAGFPLARANDLGPAGWRRLAAACAPRADACAPGLAAIIANEIMAIDRAWPAGLPQGAIHADLFPDNAFFDGPEVTGVIDFYFACTDAFAYDLAVCLNSWAGRRGAFDLARARALCAGYEAVRPLTPEEREALPALLRGSALRFLLTRLYDWLNQVPGAVVRVKDPLEFRDLLLGHRAQTAPQFWI
jgi:homoserine kinase type II